MIRSHLERDADLTVGCIPVPLERSQPVRHPRRSTNTTASPASWRSRRKPQPCPATRPTCLASMGIYVFTARPMYELLCQDAAQPRQRPRFRQEHHSGDDRHASCVFAFRFRDKNRKADALLARRRHARRLLPGEHGPDRSRSGAESVRRRMADPHVSAAIAAAQVCVLRRRRARHRPPRRSARQHGVPGLHHLRRPRAPQHPVARTCASTATPWSRTRSCSMAWTWAGTAGFARAIIDKDVKIPPDMRRSATIWSTTASAASRSRKAASS